MSPAEGILTNFFAIVGWIWWIVLPIFTFGFFWQAWMSYIRFCFITSLTWKTLEIKVSRNILQTPKAMEQIFAAAHAPYSYGFRKKQIYWDGEVELWCSFEIVSIGNKSTFFVKLPDKMRNLIESAVYAQYPDAEISEVEDHLADLPELLPNEKYDLFGYEFLLKKSSAYPIRTYPAFEDPVEERRIDPIAALFEVMSRLKPEEKLLFQIIIRSSGDELEKEAEKVLNKIMGREEKKKERGKLLPSPIFGVSFGEALRSPFEHPTLEVKEQKKEREGPTVNSFLLLTPGQRATIEAIEMKMSKLSFETTVRAIYIDKRDSFSKDNVVALMGAIRQFSTEDLNAFRPDKLLSTYVFKGMFKKWRVEWRKHNIYYRYRKLMTNAQKPLFNIEELATIYHFPMATVIAPRLERIESKKGGPPSELPMLDD